MSPFMLTMRQDQRDMSVKCKSLWSPFTSFDFLGHFVPSVESEQIHLSQNIIGHLYVRLLKSEYAYDVYLAKKGENILCCRIERTDLIQSYSEGNGVKSRMLQLLLAPVFVSSLTK